MAHVVLHKDLEQGEDYVNGLFDTQHEASQWAIAQAKALSEDDPDRVEIGDGLVVQLLEDQSYDILHEWLVLQLCEVK